MNEAPHDLRDYLFDELNAAQKAEVDAWLAVSADGRAELDRLRLTHQALTSLPEEEIPQRIAFVSDKVFEPSPWARFVSWLQFEGPRFALGSAAAMAVLFAGLWATQPSFRYGPQGFELAFGPQAPEPAPVPTPVDTLTSDQVRAVALAVLAETSNQRKAEFTSIVDDRVARSEARLAKEIDGVSEDSLAGYRLLRSEMERMYNDLPDMAMATR